MTDAYNPARLKHASEMDDAEYSAALKLARRGKFMMSSPQAATEPDVPLQSGSDTGTTTSLHTAPQATTENTGRHAAMAMSDEEYEMALEIRTGC
jgi:hypothetical protein